MSAPAIDLDELRARTPLDRLVAAHVTLKRSGSALRGPCPMHGGGKGSTSFSVRHSRYRCFSCGEHGDSISFTMWAERVAFPEAVQRLAQRAGMAVSGGVSNTPPDAAAEAQRHRQIEERRARHEAEQAAERAADIAAALAYWHAAVPLDGTLGEQYLTAIRKVEKPATGWPASLRYHPATRSVIAALTTVDGTVQAVHRALLTPTGDNLRHRDSGRKLKLGRGPQDEVCATLPASDPASPILLHGEGLETTLSPWSAAGYEARVYFGNLADKAKPERGRVNVLLVDDDGPDAAERVAHASDRWTAEGYDVLIAPAFDGVEGGGRDWNDLLRGQGPSAVLDRIAAQLAVREQRIAEIARPAVRPNCTMDDVRSVMTTETEAWVRGDGPALLLNNASTSAGKGQIPLELLSRLAITRRHERRSFIQDWRRDHPMESPHRAVEAADKAGLRPLRIGYLGDNHIVVAQHVEKARKLGLIAAHDAGMDRPYDPGDIASPPRCTQPERVKYTRLAGEPVRPVACGLNLDGPHCVDHPGCRDLQSIGDCMHAEFVGTVAERGTSSHFMPRHLLRFDFVLIDEPPDRVFRPELEVMLDLLAEHPSIVTRCLPMASRM